MSDQIQNMIGFINSEANQKVTELETEANSQYNSEKQRIQDKEKAKIKAEFEKKEKDVVLTKAKNQSNLSKEQRLRVLKEREDLMQEMMGIARQKLMSMTSNAGEYTPILANLIAESVITLKLPEKPLVIKCVQKDAKLVNNALPEAKALIKKHMKADANLSVSQEFLPETEVGGVSVETQDGRIKSVNTLKEREETIALELLPRLRKLMFD
eukprot:NODE_1692_length_872_cov_133.947752_g1330_i0.p1 GENE.NODE_1692_length_872_cov_133.947752_g1330_i0~~NODE_1692_length_872_cov_133.947752_g1330_i0.p1  ORF type:complete len:245 (+),score=61.72 NODE_1692_length_872_cov_133.947752_g1330_i0:100-735(+)